LINVKYLVKRFCLFIISLFIVASVTFLLMKAVPGDPFMQEQAIPEEIMQNLYKHYGLNQPWYVQYGNYLYKIITWNLGPSFKHEGRTVNDIIKTAFPVSFVLGLEAVFIALSMGISLGIISAIKRSKWQDHVCMAFSVIGVSIPSFILGTFLQYIFAMKLGLFPVARWGSFSQSILPAFSLAALPTAFIARLTRTNMVEVLEQDYVQTAKSKGLSTMQIVWKHVLKNSILPVIAYLGHVASTILTGSFVVEKIFGIPGLGSWFVTSIINRDYTVIMGVTVFYSALLMICMFFIDVTYTCIDPRVQLLTPKCFKHE